MSKRWPVLGLAVLIGGQLRAQSTVRGRVEDETGAALPGSTVTCVPSGCAAVSDHSGDFAVEVPAAPSVTLVVRCLGFEPDTLRVRLDVPEIDLGTVRLRKRTVELPLVEVVGREPAFGMGHLNAIEGTAIYAAKKSEVVRVTETDANKAVNSARQVLARVPGLNIQENDPGGVQLSIAARGLDPNRSSHFNLRQNGYDISADALGYPEAYYTPPMEAVERIEVVRGAASLQYGPQFGGLVNFQLRPAYAQGPLEFRSVSTVGSYGLLDTWDRVSGTVGRTGYVASYGRRTGHGWRPNTGYGLHTGFVSVTRQLSERTRLGLEYTLMRYEAQQPGGLTDAQFASDPSISLRARNWFNADWNILAAALDHRLSGRSRFNARVWGFIGGRDALGVLGDINRLDDADTPRELIKDQYRNLGSELRYLRFDTLLGTAHAWLAGTRVYRGHTRKAQGQAATTDGPLFEFAHPDQLEGSDYDFPGWNTAFFLEDLITLPDKRWRIVPGVRYERLDTRADGYYRRTTGTNVLPGPVAEQRRFERDLVLFGIGLSWKPAAWCEAYANISQNYRGITFTDMRITGVNQLVDPGLRDERGFTTDLGFKGSVGHWLTWDIGAFLLGYADRIGMVQQVDETYNIIRYTTNVGASRAWGSELYIETDLVRAVRRDAAGWQAVLFTSIGLLDARYTDSSYPTVVGNAVEFSPPLTARGGASLRNKRFSLTVQLGHTAEQFTEATNARSTPSAVNGVVPAHTVMDASARCTFGWIELRLGVNNALDAVYFTRRAPSYPGPGILPAERRSVQATVALRLEARKDKR